MLGGWGGGVGGVCLQREGHLLGGKTRVMVVRGSVRGSNEWVGPDNHYHSS